MFQSEAFGCLSCHVDDIKIDNPLTEFDMVRHYSTCDHLGMIQTSRKHKRRQPSTVSKQMTGFQSLSTSRLTGGQNMPT